jgi:hypothetical protein
MAIIYKKGFHMAKRILLSLCVFLFFLNCGQKKTQGNDDRASNGGFVRFSLQGKNMHDNFFVAQFTPAGDLLKIDNLQLYNFDTGSSKYPQLLMDINFHQSELKNWQAQTIAIDVLAFSVSPLATPLRTNGLVKILNVTDKFVEGSFSGELAHPKTGKTYSIKGEFKAVLKMNI